MTQPLAGVRALLLDLDGVLVMRNQLLPGAAESLARLDAAGFPYLIGTNMSLVSRQRLSAELIRGGLDILPGRIITAASAAAAYVAHRFPGQALFVMAAPDGLREFAGQRLISYEEAADPSRTVAAVVVGDAGEQFTSANMQAAFRLIRAGAAFVAMHKNRWWFTPEGIRLDAGAYVAALEFGTEKRAVVTGKPAPTFFGEAVRCLREAAGAGLTASGVAMVGDDLWNDVRGAQRAGMVGVFVRSGKHGDAELARAVSERGGGAPDGDYPDIAAVVDAILG